VHPDRSGSTNADPLAALRGPAPPTFRERARGLIDRIPHDARPWAVALLVTVVLAGVAMAVVVPEVVRGSTSAAGDWTLDLPMAGTGSTAVTNPTATEPPTLVVHAAGAVLHPGVYRLPPGARVDDVIAAAGGLALDSDGNRINLAATVADGERVYVPRIGEVDVPPPASGAAPATGAAPIDAPSAVDLNRATQQELEALPGVGPSIASAIIQHRERNGPFRSVDELVDVRGIGSARLEQLRDLVRV
jgi:competence protein ComEA